MNLVTPMAGLILAAAVIPPLIILYFLKLRRRPQPIACTLLWKRSVEDLRANAPFQRLRRSLLLFLQLLALLLLVASVAQPQILASEQEGGKTVLLIDNSASMTTTDIEGGMTRLDEAKRRAKERIEALHGGGLLSNSNGETMIIAFSDRAEVISPFSESRQALLEAIDRVRPTHGKTSISEGLKLARAYTSNPVDSMGEARPVGELPSLEVFSDGRIADIGDQVLRGKSMLYHRIGSADAENVTISAIDVKRPYDRATAVEVFAALLNFSEQDVTCDVQLSVSGTAMAVEEITIGAAQMSPTGQLMPGRNNVVFTPFEQPRGAVIEIASLREDDLAADNVAQVVVPPPKQLAVALVAPKSRRITDVLEGLRLKRLEILTSGQFERLAEDGSLGTYDLVVFDDYAPPLPQLPPGRYLTMGVTPPGLGLNEYGEHNAQIVLSMQDDHPALRFVNLDHLYIAKCHLLQPDDDVQVLVEGSRGPLIVTVSRGPVHVIHVPFDPLQSNWPFLNSWVTFVFNAVEYLGNLGQGLTSEGLRVGDALTTRLPAEAEEIQLVMPGGEIDPLSVDDPTMFTWGPIRLSGLYTLKWSMPGEEEPLAKSFAVNVLSESEGCISSMDNLQVGQESVAGVTGRASAYMPLWPWAIGFCLAVLMIEWWIYHRKTYV